ncbi:hypothetical protein CLOM_g7466 [Closterium sp. NIES-68]|nr:hypothetical protein CLOM_g7466 [Closterium sp. NIES-68]GJP71731.1 hypothetical protein CLOP_g2531 [Closterium sp. NIES-67]
MGRTVVADEAAIQRHADRLFREKATWELGLLIGRSNTVLQSLSAASAAASGASRDFVFALVPSPDAHEDASLAGNLQEGAAKGGRDKSGSGASECVNVDGDWVAEHALQVSRLLLGGTAVLGMYVFCSDAAYKNALPSLLQALHSLSASLTPPSSLAALLPPAPSDHLLLHISSTTRRSTARAIDPSSLSAPVITPCDFKLAPIPSPILVSSTVPVQALVPVITRPSTPPPSSSSSDSPSPPPPASLSPPSVRAAAACALRHIARQMDRGMAFVDGMMMEGGDVVGGDSNPRGGAGKAGKGGGGKGGKGGKKGGGKGGKGGGGRGGEEVASEGGTHVRVDWALPPSWNVPPQDGLKDGRVHGMVSLAGRVLALCLAMPRDPFSRVLHDLKADALRSVVSRLDLVQEGEEEQAERGGGKSGERGGGETETGGEMKGKEDEGEGVEEEEEMDESRLLTANLHRLPFTRWNLPRRVLLHCAVAVGGGVKGGGKEGGEEVEGEGGLLLADYCEEGEEVEAAEQRCGELCAMVATADGAMREEGIGVEWGGQQEGEGGEQRRMEGSAAAAVWHPPGTTLSKPRTSTRSGSSSSGSGSAAKSALQVGAGETASAGMGVPLMLAVLGALLALVAALVLAVR